VVGHDWGAEAAWALALFRPDRIRAVATLSVPYSPRLNKGTFLSTVTARLGEGFYMAQFQVGTL
jgi:pimeloyl-ACP methyl ester carboxylesterase